MEWKREKLTVTVVYEWWREYPTYQYYEKENLPTCIENDIEITDIVGGKSPVSLNTETKCQYLKFKKGGCLTTSIHENRNEVI